MDPRREVGNFLASRRHAIAPEEVGLVGGPRRRVPGLRRGEVADLAGVSVEYFSRLERGDVKGATDGVLDAVARALQLGDDERTHLHALVCAVRGEGRRSQTADLARDVRPGVRQMVESIGSPALVVDARTDILCANACARSLYAVMFTGPDPVNYARFVFADPRSRTFYPDWDAAADEVVATLRHATGLRPADTGLDDLVDELVRGSSEFGDRWAAQTVRRRTYGTKTMCLGDGGELALAYESLQLPADPGLSLIVYSAAPGSVAEETLRRLGVRNAPGSISTPSGSVRKQ